MIQAITALILVCVSHISALNNGLALTPPMGWSTWNTFKCDYTESDLQTVAKTMVASGMVEAGYKYLNIDDCWEASERTPDGHLTYNTTKFPSGLAALSDYLHSLNISFGLYTSSGPATCKGYPGSWGYFQEDADTFASWGVDFLKLDCCYQYNVSDRAVAYNSMSEALLNSGRKILFSCDTDELILKENNQEYPNEWAPPVCNMARIHWDIYDAWESTLEILRAANNIAHASQPGYWNDLDILTVGIGGQNITEYISHFQIWCITSSPLIAGNDIRSMSDEVRNVLINKEAIAINQDPLGVAGNMITRSLDGTVETWAKPLYADPNTGGEKFMAALKAMQEQGGDLPLPDFHPLPYHAVVLLNRASFTQDLFLDFNDLYGYEMWPHPNQPPFVVNVRDAWNQETIGVHTMNFTANNIPGHGSIMLTLSLL